MPRPRESCCDRDLDRLARPVVQHPSLCQQPLAQLLEVLGHTRKNGLVSACPVAAPSPSPALSQQTDMCSTLFPFPPPAGTELRNAPLWICNIPITDGIYVGQHLHVPACSYKGQPLPSVFDLAEHPHLHTDGPSDRDRTMLRPDTR